MPSILDLVLEGAIKYGPDVVRAVEDIVAEIKRTHPQLADPPPPDEEKQIDTEP